MECRFGFTWTMVKTEFTSIEHPDDAFDVIHFLKKAG